MRTRLKEDREAGSDSAFSLHMADAGTDAAEREQRRRAVRAGCEAGVEDGCERGERLRALARRDDDRHGPPAVRLERVGERVERVEADGGEHDSPDDEPGLGDGLCQRLAELAGAARGERAVGDLLKEYGVMVSWRLSRVRSRRRRPFGSTAFWK